MRYIADANGYLKYVSFGADITCNKQPCTEYTGSAPLDYNSLDDWYSAEVEKLYRWKIVDGQLTLDPNAVPPEEYGGSSGGGTTPEELPVATTSTLGVIKVGDNLDISGDGTLSVITTDEIEMNNTKPVTAAAVYVQLGNVEALLGAL